MALPPDQAPARQWDAGLYDDQYSFVWKYGAELIALLAPRPGERILDLGSGTGHLTARIAELGATVIGLDSSSAMVEQAQRHYPDLEFVVGDGADFHFPEAFDAVFSNATLHWVTRAAGAAKCIAAALKPGGRLVAELGGKGNVQAITTAIQRARAVVGLPDRPDLSPWYYPSIAEYATLLEQHGLSVVEARLFNRPTPLDGGEEGLRNWLHMFAESYFAEVPASQRETVLAEIERHLRPEWYRDATWIADYRRLRLIALKELE